MKNLGKLLFAGGVIAAVAHMSKRKKKKTSSSTGGGVVIDEEPVIDEVVPAPADATTIYSGEEYSAPLEATVQFWVSEYDGAFGWQYVIKGDENGDGEISYLDGIIYHYESQESALDDLMSIIR